MFQDSESRLLPVNFIPLFLKHNQKSYGMSRKVKTTDKVYSEGNLLPLTIGLNPNNAVTNRKVTAVHFVSWQFCKMFCNNSSQNS